MRKLLLGSVLALSAGAAQAGNITPYYLVDGDNARAVVIQDGAVVNSFAVPFRGYPIAINGTVWVGDRDNEGATEYTLGGTPTGNTGAGGAWLSQILDGTTDGTNNFGVSCCDSQAVTIAATDWSNQSILFDLDYGANGIAYDPTTTSLFVSFFGGGIAQYDMQGNVLGLFMAELVGLAYEAATDTLWGWDPFASALVQYSKTGDLLETNPVDVAQYGLTNPFGGEMAASLAVEVTEPASLALFGAGVIGLGLGRRRRRG